MFTARMRESSTCCIGTVGVQSMLVSFEESSDRFCGSRHWEKVSRDASWAERRTFMDPELRGRYDIEEDAVCGT